jgi:hypothetical protein
VKKLRKLLSLSSGERRLLAKAALWVATVRLMLWVLPFRSQRSLLARFEGPTARESENDPLLPERIAWAVQLASRYIPRASCLTQAVAAKILLHRAGYGAELHIGVGKDDNGRFQAHAWVESGDRVLIGGCQLEQYAPLYTFEGLKTTTLRSLARLVKPGS